MGLGKKAFEHILTALAAMEGKGEVLTLGVQDIHFDERWFRKELKRQGAPLPDDWVAEISEKPYFQKRNYLTQQCVFSAIGVNEVRSLDASSFEGCDFVFDLNNPQPPPELCNRFSLIFDGGTLEHIFHVPNALTAIHRMLGPGGIIVHQSPTSNYVDHGFFSFSPTFFEDYYRTAGYRVGEHWLISHLKNGDNQKAKVVMHEPGSTGLVGKLDSRMYATFFWAAKQADSGELRIPQQGYYQRAWK
jgi:hypothetical protein